MFGWNSAAELEPAPESKPGLDPLTATINALLSQETTDNLATWVVKQYRKSHAEEKRLCSAQNAVMYENLYVFLLIPRVGWQHLKWEVKRFSMHSFTTHIIDDYTTRAENILSRLRVFYAELRKPQYHQLAEVVPMFNLGADLIPHYLEQSVTDWLQLFHDYAM